MRILFGLVVILASLIATQPNFAQTPPNVKNDPDVVTAKKLMDAGNWTEALRLNQTLVQRYPNEAMLWCNLGLAYGHSNQPADAVSAFQRAVRIKTDFGYAWYNLGLAYGFSHRPADAVSAFQQAVKIEPNDPKAWYCLGWMYGDSNRSAEAIPAFQQAVKIKPDYTDAWFNLGLAYSNSQRPVDAIAAFQQVVKIKPDNANAWYNLGEAYSKSGHAAEAQQALMRLESINPDLAGKLRPLIGQKSPSAQPTASAPPVQPPVPASQPVAATPTPAVAQTDPVAMLKAHLERLQKSCAEHEVIRFSDGVENPRDRHGEELGDLRYDVQKTSSLVSPIIGRVSFKMIDRDSEVGKHFGRYWQYDVTLGFRDSAWVLTDMKCRGNMGGKWYEADPDLDERIRQQAAEEFRKRMGVR